MTDSREIGSGTISAPDVHVASGQGESGWSRRLWWMLAVLCGAMFLDALDNAMAGIAVPPIKAQLGMSTAAVQWVVSAYVLGFGGFLLLGGRLADLVGRRRMLLTGAAMFAAAALAGGLAHTGMLVIAARFVMGISAAFTAPAGLAIIVTTFPEGGPRNRAVSIYTAFGAAGFSLGLIASGLLTQVSWRLTFFLPVVVAILVLAGAARLVPRDEAGAGGPRRYDAGGAITVTAAMLLLVYTIVQAPSTGWLTGWTLGQLAAVLVLVVAFAAIEGRTREPLLRLGFLRNGSLVGAALVAAAILGTYLSFQFVGALYLQSLRGWSPLEMALAFLPCGVLIGMIAPRAGGLISRFGPRWMMFAGFVAYTAAYALFWGINLTSQYAVALLPTMLLIGVAFPLSFTGANVQATSGVRAGEQGLAAGVLQAGYQIGAAVVLAVVTATMSASHAVTGHPQAVLSSYHHGLYVVTGFSAVTMIATLVAAVRGAATSARRRGRRANRWTRHHPC